MSAQGRSGGTRRRRITEAAAAAAAPAVPDTGHAPDVDLLEDRSVAIAGGRRGVNLGRSLPGAIAGTVLVVGLAFGAAPWPGGALGPARDSDKTGDTAAADGGTAAGHEGSDGDDSYHGDGDGTKDDEYEWGDGPDATDKPDEPAETDKPDGDHPDATEKPDVEPTAKPDVDPTPKPTEKPDATKPPTEAIALGLAIKEYHPLIEWGSCAGLDFDYYKVVRSTDSTVHWPTGEGDELIGAVERGGTRKAWDKYSPHEVKVWYRVFCVRQGEDGWKVVNASATKDIEVPAEPEPPTPPNPITLGLEANLTDGGKVRLDWSAREVDGFAFYKVLRSSWNEDPSYLPWHDGTDVVGVIEAMGATQLEVGAPEAGHTAWYRVQCIGYLGDQKVLLGESAVLAVTIE